MPLLSSVGFAILFRYHPRSHILSDVFSIDLQVCEGLAAYFFLLLCCVATDDFVEICSCLKWSALLFFSILKKAGKMISKSCRLMFLSHIILIIIPVCTLNYSPFLYMKRKITYLWYIMWQSQDLNHFQKFQSPIFLCYIVLLLEYLLPEFIHPSLKINRAVSDHCVLPISYCGT